MKYSYLLFPTTVIFIACGGNTTTPIAKDTQSIGIDQNGSTFEIYPTDLNNTLSLNATAHYNDGSSSDITNYATWDATKRSDSALYDGITLLFGEVRPYANGAEANVSISYGKITSSDYVTIKVHKLIKVNFLNLPTTTGYFEGIAFFGDFENGETNRTLLSNVVYSSDDNSSITLNDNNVSFDLNITSLPTTITLSVFSDVFETNITE